MAIAPDTRTLAHSRALRTADSFVTHARAMLLHAALGAAQLAVEARERDGIGASGMNGSSGSSGSGGNRDREVAVAGAVAAGGALAK